MYFMFIRCLVAMNTSFAYFDIRSIGVKYPVTFIIIFILIIISL